MQRLDRAGAFGKEELLRSLAEVPVNLLQKAPSFFSTFPVFVPSLPWQDDDI
jgi:hypothetical protein